MRLTVKERVFILESYLKRCFTPTVDKVYLKNLEGKRQEKVLLRKFFKKFRETGSNERKLRNVERKMVKRVDKCMEMNGRHFQHLM
jgi:hypothetical protein